MVSHIYKRISASMNAKNQSHLRGKHSLPYLSRWSQQKAEIRCLFLIIFAGTCRYSALCRGRWNGVKERSDFFGQGCMQRDQLKQESGRSNWLPLVFNTQPLRSQCTCVNWKHNNDTSVPHRLKSYTQNCLCAITLSTTLHVTKYLEAFLAGSYLQTQVMKPFSNKAK